MTTFSCMLTLIKLLIATKNPLFDFLHIIVTMVTSSYLIEKTTI